MKKGTYKNLVGQQFNRLFCVRFTGIVKTRATFLWRCVCGVEKIMEGKKVSVGHTKSCGCLEMEVKKARIIKWNKSDVDKTRGGRKRKDGYTFIQSKDHPHRSKEGYVALHRLRAEEKIKRYLKPKEIVHHWNEQPGDNSLDNLIVLRHQAAHVRLHLFAKRHGINIELLKFETPWLYE